MGFDIGLGEGHECWVIVGEMVSKLMFAHCGGACDAEVLSGLMQKRGAEIDLDDAATLRHGGRLA